MIKIPKKYIRNITIEGLSGRVLHLPAKKGMKSKKKILLVPGQHTSHERMYGISQYLNEYGEVYSIDLPGYGGMDSFYKIDKEPSIDAYAHYIYTIMKTLKLDKNVWIVGNSLGFLYTTRMLQLHKSMHTSVDEVIALVGFTGGKDFAMKKHMWYIINAICFFGKTRIGVFLAKLIALNPFSLRIMLNTFALVKDRMKQPDQNQKDIIDMEIHLWTDNDQRTHGKTTWDLFRADLTDIKEKLPYTVVNITAKEDQYFDAAKVKKGMLEIYKGHKTMYLDIDAHSPSIIGSPEDFGNAIPKEVEKLLSK